MYNSKIAGLGFYVPENVVTNDDLSRVMETSDAWIQERTGILERRHVDRDEDTTTAMGVKAARIAIERAGIDKDEIYSCTAQRDVRFPDPHYTVRAWRGVVTYLLRQYEFLYE